MLAIRMQRTGRKGHAAFRVVVQDSRLSPKSGKVVERLGSYDPHTKQTSLVKERAEHFLKNGAQPSPRVAALLKAQGIKLPEWVVLSDKKESGIKNPDKLRKNRPAEEAPAEEPAAETNEAADTTDAAPAEAEATEPAAEAEAPAEEPAA